MMWLQEQDVTAGVTQMIQSSNLILDIATYRLNQPRGQCSETHLKCITMWEGRAGVTITIFFQHTIQGMDTGPAIYKTTPP